MRRSILAVFAGIFFLNHALCQDPIRFQSEIKQIREATAGYLPTANLVLFTGSSSIRMWTDVQSDFPEITVLNTGFGGSHMSELLYYADTLILRFSPAKIFIYEGDNDIASGKKPEVILKDAARLVDRIRKQLPHSKIFFIAAKPSLQRWNLRNEYLNLNRQLEGFALMHQDVFYIDIWSRMLNGQGNPRTDVFLEDGLHMNRKGYDIWKEIIGDILRSDTSWRPVTFGVCTSSLNAGMLKSAGFSYLEGGVQRDLVPGHPEPDFIRKRAEMDTCALPVIACNGFLPGTLKVTGPDARPDTVLRYAEVAFRRAASAGIRTIVFGSSGARSIPEGFDRQQARMQFVQLLKRMGPIAEKYGILVAIENLQKSETNFINTVEEASSIAREVDHPNIRILADIFHMMRENENPEVLISAKDFLVHCHIAELRDRTAPGMAGDDFSPYFKVLKEIGYQGGISIEGSWKNEDLPKAFQVLKAQWDN